MIPMDASRYNPGLTLTCRPRRENRRFIFEYVIFNPGERDVYVQDAMPAVDRDSKAASANQAAVSVIHAPSGDAIVGKYVPPMSANLRPAVPIAPLARLLGSGQSLDRKLEVPEPLAETSPWLPDLLLRQYEITDIPAITFMVGYWVVGDPGFGAMPAPYADGLFRIAFGAGGPAESTRLVNQRFATRGLQIFRRTDDFPRTL
jgi:hypothetical protein